VTQQIILNGLMSGSTYVLMALGFTLIFGIMRIVNFSHGELYMCGSYFVLTFYQLLGLNYFLSLLLAALITAGIGALVERALLRPLVGKELNGMIMTLAVGIAFQSTALIIFGPDEQSMDRPVTGVWRIHELAIPFDRLFVTGSSAGILLLFYAFLKLSRTGKAMQAVAQDAEAASLMGIRPGRVRTLAFAIASGLAALAGGLLAPLYSAGPYVGELPMLKSFVIVVLGGLGSIPGAIIGGLLIGLIESAFTTLGNSSVAMIASFTLVLAIVLFRPLGLMGTKP
jgi:branched-chain amino acid transport system permease protein